MEPMRVLCLWDVSFCPWTLDKLRQVAQVDVIYPPNRAQVLEIIGQYDAYLASLYVQCDRELLERATKLKVVATPSTGLDHLDLPALQERGIEMQCIKTDFGLLDRVTATAEMAWTLMLAAARKLPMAHQAALQGDWARDRFRGRQLSGQTLGILGVGRLGRMMAEYGQGFRMKVIGCDTAPRFIVPGVEYVSFDELLARSDVLSIHIHLTPENRHLINADVISRMKDGAIIVNTSRGGIIDEDALAAALRKGKLGGAGLDVIDGEWRSDLVNHPLIALAREMDTVVISPHLGGGTVESQAAAHQFVANRLADTLSALVGAR